MQTAKRWERKQTNFIALNTPRETISFMMIPHYFLPAGWRVNATSVSLANRLLVLLSRRYDKRFNFRCLNVRRSQQSEFSSLSPSPRQAIDFGPEVNRYPWKKCTLQRHRLVTRMIFLIITRIERSFSFIRQNVVNPTSLNFDLSVVRK